MNLSDKVQLSFVNVLGNFPIPFVFKNPDDILAWNMKVDEYITRVFDFAHMFLASNGVVLLFHPDDLKVLKEVKSYLESYGFLIRMKWVVVNSLPLRVVRTRLSRFHFNPLSFICIFLLINFS
jgi:hypothetical protein